MARADQHRDVIGASLMSEAEVHARQAAGEAFRDYPLPIEELFDLTRVDRLGPLLRKTVRLAKVVSGDRTRGYTVQEYVGNESAIQGNIGLIRHPFAVSDIPAGTAVIVAEDRDGELFILSTVPGTAGGSSISVPYGGYVLIDAGDVPTPPEGTKNFFIDTNDVPGYKTSDGNVEQLYSLLSGDVYKVKSRDTAFAGPWNSYTLTGIVFNTADGTEADLEDISGVWIRDNGTALAVDTPVGIPHGTTSRRYAWPFAVGV